MRYFRCIFFLGALLVVDGCARVALTAVNLPSHFDSTEIIHDVSYGPKPWQKLDIYVPADAKGKRLDVVVFFYGGRWTYGAKEDYRFMGAAFSGSDFITVIPDYSKYPQARFPVFVQDGAKALSWIYDNVTAYGGNAERIHVMGHSAGAHIGALLTADARYLAAEGKKSREVIRDFAGLAGPYSFTPDEPDLEDMFGPPANYPQMQVTTFIDGKQPPMLLLHGDADTDVKKYNLTRLEKRIHEKGGCVESRIYPDVDHIGIIGDMSWLGDGPEFGDIVIFFRSGCHRP